jgi:hypothetical protein
MNDIDFTTLRCDVGYWHMLSEEIHTVEQGDKTLQFRYGIQSNDDPEHDGIKLTDLLVIPVPSQVCYSRLKDLAQGYLDPQKMVGDDSLDNPYWGEALREYSIPIDGVTLGCPDQYTSDIPVGPDVELDETTFLDELGPKLAEIYQDRDPADFDLRDPINRAGHIGWEMLRFYGTAFRGAPTQFASKDDMVGSLSYIEPVPSKVVARDPDRIFETREEVIVAAPELDYPLYVGPVQFGFGSYGTTDYEAYGVWSE